MPASPINRGAGATNAFAAANVVAASPVAP